MAERFLLFFLCQNGHHDNTAFTGWVIKKKTHLEIGGLTAQNGHICPVKCVCDDFL